MFKFQFSSILYQTRHFKIEKSHFSSSLGPVIYDSTTLTSQTFTASQYLADSSNSVISSVFQNINRASAGVLFQITSIADSFDLQSCIIHDCFCTNNNASSGLMYITNHNSIYIVSTYFFQTSSFYGSILNALSNTNINIEKITGERTGFSQFPGSDGALYLQAKELTLNLNNFTDNTVINRGSTAYCDVDQNITITYCYSLRCRGINILYLSGTPTTSNVNNLLFINTTSDAAVCTSGIWRISDSVFTSISGNFGSAQYGVLYFVNSLFNSEQTSNIDILYDSCGYYIEDIDSILNGRTNDFSKTQIPFVYYSSTEIPAPTYNNVNTTPYNKVTVFIILLIVILVLLIAAFLVYYFYFSKCIRGTVAEEYHKDLISRTKEQKEEDADNEIIVDVDDQPKPIYDLDN